MKLVRRNSSRSKTELVTCKIRKARGYSDESISEITEQVKEAGLDANKTIKSLLGRFQHMGKIIESKTKLRVQTVGFKGDVYEVKTEQGITVHIFSPLKQGGGDLKFIQRNISEGDDYTIDQLKKMFPNHYITWF